MATYRYTGLDDLQEVIRIAFDRSESTERRIQAIVDLSMLRDEYDWLEDRLLEMAGDKSELPVIRGEVFDQISHSWDASAIPVVAAALQDESVEVRFWAAFATETIRRQISDKAASQFIPLLDKLAASNQVYEGWWHEGREALAALETLCYKKIAPPFEGDSTTRLISPMPEYMTYERLKWQNKTPPDISPLKLEPDRLKYHLRLRFYDVKFDVRHPRLTCYQLNWQISRGKNLLLGALHQDGYGIVLTGRDEEKIARFALWYRSIIPPKIPLYWYEWADEARELRHRMKLAEITQGLN